MSDNNTEIPFELTATQMAIWLDQALHPGKPIYNTGQVLTLETDIDLASFNEALKRTISENDALRLRFSQSGAGLVQQVIDSDETTLEFIDFAMDAEPETSARNWLEKIFWNPVSPFDFPLFKFALARVSDRRFLWLQRYHHLIIDATGRQLVASRVATIYDALRGASSIPDEKSTSYRRAKDNEDEYLSSDEYKDDEAYWKGRFADLPDPIVSSPASLSEKLRSGLAARVDCGLTSAESARLRQFAREHNSSPFKVILSLAWACFNRLYRTDDLIFGVPLAGRGKAELRTTVGLFAKVMPFRMRLDATLTLRAAMAAIDELLSEDLKHQRYPSDHINRLLKLRQLKRAGLHEIGLNYVRMHYAFDFGGNPVSCATLSTGFALPWGISAFDPGEHDAIRIMIEYDHGRILPQDAERLGRSLAGLLEKIDELAEVPLFRLPVDLDAAWTDRSGLHVPDERTVRELPDKEPDPRAESHLSRNLIEVQLLEIWRRQLNNGTVDVHDDYFDLGGDSLRAVSLVGECSDQFGIKMPLSVLFESPTVAEMARLISSSAAIASPSRLIRLRNGNGESPLLLVHPIGGSIYCYTDLVSNLKLSCPIYGLQAAGLQCDENLPRSIEEMAQDYLTMAEPIIGTGAMHLAGWSFGGLVAVEMARQLALSGREVASVTLIDSPVRLHPRSEENEDEVLRLAAGALGVMPEMLSISNDQIARVTRLVRNARGLRHHYQPQRISVPLTLVRAGLDMRTPDDEFDWTDVAGRQVKTFVLPATHDSIIRRPHAEAIAGLLTETMTANNGSQ